MVDDKQLQDSRDLGWRLAKNLQADVDDLKATLKQIAETNALPGSWADTRKMALDCLARCEARRES